MPAVTDAYFTAAEYRTGISPGKVDTSADGEILNDALAVSRFLDQRLGRYFTKDAAAVARDFYSPAQGPIYPEAENPWRFAGKYSRTLHLLDSDLVSVTSIVTDDNGDGTPETTWQATDYQLLPLNATTGPEPRPYKGVYVPIWSTKLGWPPTRMVRVTGIWGWPSIPAPLKRGAINLTALLRLETPRAQSSQDGLGLMVQVNREARGIVDDLVRVYARASF